VNSSTTRIVALCALLAACGGGDAPDAGVAEEQETTTTSGSPIGSVSILEPETSAELMINSVTVRLSVEGLRVVPAGEMTPGTGHHHLFLDADVTNAGEPIPTVPGSIVHMGDGASEYTFDNVSRGQHRLIAVVADGSHVPLQPWVVDTVVFNVH